MSSQQQRALLAFVSVVAVVFGSYWWLSHSAQASSEFTVEKSAAPPVLADVGKVIVDVQGAVKNPGVISLPSDSRVIDAVMAAGGLVPGAIAGTNLARVVVDGEQIVVGATSAESADDGKVHLNRATQSQLEELPGVGPVLAARLISYRDEHGGIRNLGALDAVAGVGPAILENLKDLVAFD